MVRGLITRSLLSADHVLGKVQWTEVCFACLAWLYGLFAGTAISLTNAYAGCGRPALNFIERIDLGRSKGRSVPTSKPLHLVTYVQNVDQFSMSMNLKMFCRLCLILYCLIILCIILCDTSKASENLTFVLKQSLILSSVFAVIIICCLGAMKIKDCRTNYIRFISKL